MMRAVMWRWLKNLLIYYAVRGAVRLVGLTPARWVYPMGNLLGRIAYRAAGFESRLAREQLARSFHLPTNGYRTVALSKGVFCELGKSVVELARLLGRPTRLPPVVLSDESKRALDAALARDRGVVFVTGHIGNWELMAIALSRLGYPISTVARQSYDARFTRWIQRVREGFGVAVIYRHEPGAAAAMLRTLRSGRILGFLIDQDTDVPSAFVPFFGRTASTPIGAGVFARSTGAPVVVGTIRRAPSGTHHIDITPLDVSDDPEGATREMTARLESTIRRHPAQWVWFHRRWKTRPDERAA